MLELTFQDPVNKGCVCLLKPLTAGQYFELTNIGAQVNMSLRMQMMYRDVLISAYNVPRFRPAGKIFETFVATFENCENVDMEHINRALTFLHENARLSEEELGNLVSQSTFPSTNPLSTASDVTA